MQWRFQDPWWLLALLIPLLVLIWRPRQGAMSFGAYLLAARALRPSWYPLFGRVVLAAGLACAVLALARPQYGSEVVERDYSGRDLMLLLDLSGSMIADDMFDENDQRIDRLAAVVQSAKVFIDGRSSDRLGLTVFGETALTVCPPTLDHGALIEILDDVERQMRDEWQEVTRDGIPGSGIVGPATNTGLGIAKALVHLQSIDADAGKAIILLTDGLDTRRLPNWVDPLQAAAQAKRLGVRIHAVGVGDRQGMMTDPRLLRFTGQRRLVSIAREWPMFLPDQARLTEIVALADGESMHADSREDMLRIFARIDELEPSQEVFRRRENFADRFYWPLLGAVLLLGLALVTEPRWRGVPA